MQNKRMFFALCMTLICHSAAFAHDHPSAVSSSTILKTQTSWDGKQIEYPAGTPEITGMVIEIAPGSETGWHSHSALSFAIVVEGELEVHLENGQVNRLKAGDALAEVVDTLHNGHNVGNGPVKLVVFYAGVVGQQLTAEAE